MSQKNYPRDHVTLKMSRAIRPLWYYYPSFCCIICIVISCFISIYSSYIYQALLLGRSINRNRPFHQTTAVFLVLIRVPKISEIRGES